MCSLCVQLAFTEFFPGLGVWSAGRAVRGTFEGPIPLQGGQLYLNHQGLARSLRFGNPWASQQVGGDTGHLGCDSRQC